MSYPERPTCHDGEQRFTGGQIIWRDSDGYAPFRTCSYCGSVHPEDLMALVLGNKATLGGSDWKYGWPHKFYLKGNVVGKWYNRHLLDAGFRQEALDALCDLFAKHAGIRFELRDGDLFYRAPYKGYQA